MEDNVGLLTAGLFDRLPSRSLAHMTPVSIPAVSAGAFNTACVYSHNIRVRLLAGA